MNISNSLHVISKNDARKISKDVSAIPKARRYQNLFGY